MIVAPTARDGKRPVIHPADLVVTEEIFTYRRAYLRNIVCDLFHELIVIDIERMMRIADTSHCRSGATLLAGALAESRRIGELVVVQDVIEVEALGTLRKTFHRLAVKRRGVDVLADIKMAYLEIAAVINVIEVNTT